MTRGRRQLEPEAMAKLDICVKLMVCQVTRCNGQAIVNIATGLNVAAVAVSCACAVEARVLDTGLGIDSCAENPHNGSHNALGAESRSAIPKGHGGVKIGQIAPPDCEEDSLRGIQLEPTVPAAEVQLEHKQPLARVQDSTFLDELDNGFCGRKEQFPDSAAVSMSRNEGVNAVAQL